MRFNNSYEVIEVIEQRKTNGIELRSFSAFMESLGNPQNKLKCIHIGGTNGKGSTTNALYHMLKEAGYCVGMFTSPYLETHHDRIRVNNNYIEDAYIVDIANTYFDKWEQFSLSMFEIDMFISVMYFLDKEVDFALYEVGLGGERDATNIISPVVSVITNIGMDHMDYLGNTYMDIAKAKAGIVKKGTALITMEQKDECINVFEETCARQGSELIVCTPPSAVEVNDALMFVYKGVQYTQDVLASYQAYNSALAIETIHYLVNKQIVSISTKQIMNGIYDSKWKGRFEVVSKDPFIIVDGAHNMEGIEALCEASKCLQSVHIVFSALQDKPYAQMLTKLKTISSDIRVCEFDFYRAASLDSLLVEDGIKGYQDYTQAIEESIQQGGVTLICGSLYFISIVRTYIANRGRA